MQEWVQGEGERRANCCGFSVLRGIVFQTLLLQRWTPLSSRLLGERGRSQVVLRPQKSVLMGAEESRGRERLRSSIKMSFTLLFTLSFSYFISLSPNVSLYNVTSSWRFSPSVYFWLVFVGWCSQCGWYRTAALNPPHLRHKKTGSENVMARLERPVLVQHKNTWRWLERSPHTWAAVTHFAALMCGITPPHSPPPPQVKGS